MGRKAGAHIRLSDGFFNNKVSGVSAFSLYVCQQSEGSKKKPSFNAELTGGVLQSASSSAGGLEVTLEGEEQGHSCVSC